MRSARPQAQPHRIPLSPADLSVVLGANVLALRNRRGLSQQDFADMVGLSRPTISRIERGLGNPLLHDIHKIADACDVNAYELLLPSEAYLDQVADSIIKRLSAFGSAANMGPGADELAAAIQAHGLSDGLLAEEA